MRKTILGYISAAKEENNEKRMKNSSSGGKKEKGHRGENLLDLKTDKEFVKAYAYD